MHTVINDDCRAVLQRSGNHHHLVLTDPPYAISNKRNTGDSSKKFSGYNSDKGDWDIIVPPEEWVPLACSALSDGGVFACFGYFEVLIGVYQALQKQGMRFQSVLNWHKTNPAPCIHRRMLTHSNEFVLVFSKGKKWYFDYAFSKTLNNGKQKHNHWNGPVAQKEAGVTAKPLWLCEDIIGLFCPPDGVVLDCFGGSGTIAKAAQNTNRRSVSIEIDAGRSSYIKKRLGVG